MIEYVTVHNDSAAISSAWDFAGASRGNTDNGRAYVTVSASGDDLIVSVYSDAKRSALVAQGTLVSATSGAVTLAEQNQSGLSGAVSLADGAANPGIDIDIFYACDADVTARQTGVAAFLTGGQFTGETGFALPARHAKQVVDSLLEVRGLQGKRFDGLSALAEVSTLYALFFIYDHLSERGDDSASDLAHRFRRQAREALPRVRLVIDGITHAPFISRIFRA